MSCPGKNGRVWWHCDKLNSSLGGSVFLPNSARRKTCLLGGILRVALCPGCARSAQLPRLERYQAVGLFRVCLHPEAGGKAPSPRATLYRVAKNRRSAFGVRRSAFSVQRSAFSVQRSAFSVRRSAFGVAVKSNRVKNRGVRSVKDNAVFCRIDFRPPYVFAFFSHFLFSHFHLQPLIVTHSQICRHAPLRHAER